MVPRDGLIGVVHLLPLPGSPGYGGRMDPIVERARREARIYEQEGATGVIVENYGDAPFFKEDLPPEAVAALARCVAEVRASVGIPVGVNALRNDARAALGVAVATDASFLRVNVLAGVVATDQGLIEGRAAETLRLRAALRAKVGILADVHVKHGRPLFAAGVAEAARDLVHRAGADALVVSGPATGAPTDLHDLRAVREALPDAMLIAGSGVTAESVRAVLEFADAVIVATALKRGGRTSNPVDPKRVATFVARMRESGA